MHYRILLPAVFLACIFNVNAMWQEQQDHYIPRYIDDPWSREDEIRRQEEKDASYRNIEINRKNETWALIQAARFNKVSEAGEAINNGADIYGKSSSGGCMSRYDDEPIMSTIQYDSVDVFKILKAKYANDPLFPRELNWIELARENGAQKILKFLGYEK